MAEPKRTDIRQPDGRAVYLYGAFQPAPVGYQPGAIAEGAYERRWNPLRKEWVLVAAGRQGRTFLPSAATCPLCPSTDSRSTEIPASSFDAAVFENRFPGLRSGAPLRQSSIDVAGAVKVEPSAGVSEVVVYTPDHEASFASLPKTSLELLGLVWCDRYDELSRRPDVRYVFIFENRGEAVGVTLHHPHGQIYAYPFLPPVPALELNPDGGAGDECQQCRLVGAEQAAGLRVLCEEAGVLTYVPGYARWSYEVHVAPLEHVPGLSDFAAETRLVFMRQLQAVARAYDRLFDVPMPYMMVIHQAPARERDHPQAHLHAEFYPLLRDRGKLKYLAGAESGVGTFLNDAVPEESAQRLRPLFGQSPEQLVEAGDGTAQLQRQ